MEEIKAIITDMDGTAVQYPNKPFYSSWDALAGVLSEEKRREWFGLRDFYVEKKESYKEWFDKQVSLLKGISLKEAEKILFPIPYSLGFEDFFRNNNGFKKAILSSGIDFVIKKIAEDNGFDYWIAQKIEVKRGFFTGKGDSFKSLNKLEYLNKILDYLNISCKNTCYIGDHPSDIPCLEFVTFPMAFNPKNGLENYVKENKIPLITDFRELYKILK